jgi:hypothetical protein
MKYFILLSLFCFQLFAQDAPPNEPPFVSSDAEAEANLEKELAEFENSETSKDSEAKEDFEDFKSSEASVNNDSSKSKKDSSNGLMVETTENPAPKALIESNLSSRPDAKSEPLFVKPAGPKQGGVLKVPHPNTAKGLLKIDKDGSYQYKVRLRPKSQSSSFRFGFYDSAKNHGY